MRSRLTASAGLMVHRWAISTLYSPVRDGTVADRRVGMTEDAGPTGFAASRARLEEVISWAAGQGAAAASHGELEAYLVAGARETFRQLFQGSVRGPV